jgi:hypothetical protein
VNDAEHRQFRLDPIDGLTSQDVQPRPGAEMTQVRLDLPSTTVESSHGFRMRIAHPACPTALVLRYGLPDAPEQG